MYEIYTVTIKTGAGDFTNKDLAIILSPSFTVML